MKQAWIGIVLALIGCGSTTSPDGGTVRHEFTGNVSDGMAKTQVYYERGLPDVIEYPGPHIEEWTYVAERPAPQRDDAIVPNPFPRYGIDPKTHRTIYRFEHGLLRETIELKPGEHRKAS